MASPHDKLRRRPGAPTSQDDSTAISVGDEFAFIFWRHDLHSEQKLNPNEVMLVVVFLRTSTGIYWVDASGGLTESYIIP